MLQQHACLNFIWLIENQERETSCPQKQHNVSGLISYVHSLVREIDYERGKKILKIPILGICLTCVPFTH